MAAHLLSLCFRLPKTLTTSLRSGGGAARQVVRGCLTGVYEPLFGAALLAEYEHAEFAAFRRRFICDVQRISSAIFWRMVFEGADASRAVRSRPPRSLGAAAA